MRAMVVYESIFGNTQAIAMAIACGLATSMKVDLVDSASAPATLDGSIELLVVGSPTHAFGFTRPVTRQTAVQQGATLFPAASVGLREWLNTLNRSPGTRAATFDTRIERPRVAGSAARAAARRLRRLGLRPVVAPVSFYVMGTPGPLVEGEMERAERWGVQVASALAAPVSV